MLCFSPGLHPRVTTVKPKAVFLFLTKVKGRWMRKLLDKRICPESRKHSGTVSVALLNSGDKENFL